MTELELTYTIPAEEQEILRVPLQEAFLDPEEATPAQIMEHILHTAMQLPPRQRLTYSRVAPLDVGGFYDLFQRLVMAEQQAEHAADLVVVQGEFAPADLRDEVITLKLTRREPGTFGQRQPFQEPRQYMPVLREVFPDPAHQHYRIAVLGQWFDNLVDITCWARTHKQVMARAAWLEDLILRCTWFFMRQGIHRLLYLGQGEDQMVQQANIIYYGRPLRCFLRTEKLFTISEKAIEEVVVRLKPQLAHEDITNG